MGRGVKERQKGQAIWSGVPNSTAEGRAGQRKDKGFQTINEGQAGRLASGAAFN